MTAEPLTLITAIATALLFLVNWRAANAAKQNADVAAREFRLLRRPLATVTWDDRPQMLGNLVVLFGTVKEVAGIPTTLHAMQASAVSAFSPPEPEAWKEEEANVTLDRDVSTFDFTLLVPCPESMRGPDVDPVVVARLTVTLSISVAEGGATRELWQMTGELHWDGRQECGVVPSMHARRLAVREHRLRSRIVDPVLRAWERFWDSVC